VWARMGWEASVHPTQPCHPSRLMHSTHRPSNLCLTQAVRLERFAVYLEHDFQPYRPPDGQSWQSLKNGIKEWDSVFYAPIYARDAQQADGHPPGSAPVSSSSASASSVSLGSVSGASQVNATCCPALSLLCAALAAL